jgi:hypothetical protein
MPYQMQRTSGKAIAALVLGIVSVCIAAYLGVICGVIGLVLGILGMKEVDRNPQAVKGKGMAIAGVVLGSIGIVLQIIFLFIFGLAFAAIFECLEDPEAPGCEDFQDPDTSKADGLPTVVGRMPTGGWASFAGLPWAVETAPS